MGTSLTTRFGWRDRTFALIYGLKCARQDRALWVLSFDYRREEWTVETYVDFVQKGPIICKDDIRYLLPFGEITRLI